MRPDPHGSDRSAARWRRGPTVLALVGAALVAGGAAVAVAAHDGRTACERYADDAQRQDYASFAEAQAVQARGLAECMAEQSGLDGD